MVIQQLNLKIEKVRKMSSKYQCKRFKRNHMNISSTTQQQQSITKPERFDTASLSSITYQKSCEDLYKRKQLDLSQNLDFAQRLNKLQSSFQFQKRQRLHDYNRLMKMIKQMQCKHSSIIYNSQIRYCKSPPKPQFFHASPTTQNFLKKFSSVTNLTAKGKQNGNTQIAKTLRNKVELQRQKLASEANKDYNLEQRTIVKQNPQKIEIYDKKLQNKLKQDLELFIYSHLQHINAKMEQKIGQKIAEDQLFIVERLNQCLKLNEQKIQQVGKTLSQNNQIALSQLSNKNLTISQIRSKEIAQRFKKQLQSVQNKIMRQIQNILIKFQQQSNFNSIYRKQMDKKEQIFETKIEKLVNKCFQNIKKIQEESYNLRQLLTNSNINKASSDNIVNQKIILQLKQKIQKIEKYNVSNISISFDSKLKQLQKYVKTMNQIIKKQINDVKFNSQNNYVATVNQLNTRIQDLQKSLSNSYSGLQTRFEHMSSTVNHQSKQIVNIETNMQTSNNLYSNKIYEVLQVMNNKFSNFQKDRQLMVEKQRIQKLKQLNQESQKQKERQIIYKNIEQRMNNKIQIIKIVCSKQIQSRYQKSQSELQKVIEKHICYVENFISKLMEKQQTIMRKFIKDNQSTQASLTPRKF